MGKDLVQLIKDNPGATAIIDNDGWTLYRTNPADCPYDSSGSAYDDWMERNELANDSNVKPLGDGGYGSGSEYGGDILQALAQIVGLRVESV